LEALFHKYEHLKHNFPNSIFPAAGFNCGPQTIALDHTDYNNLSHGLCALTALGSYDHKQGGHLILFGLKLVIQFPSGSTALIPSGCLGHGNTPNCDGETRMSIAQYAAWTVPLGCLWVPIRQVAPPNKVWQTLEREN